MKAIVILLTLVISINSAACDWSTIQDDKAGYLYTPQCHLSVGKLVKIEEKRESQVKSLNESLSFKDLALKQSDDRAEIWKKEAENQNILLQKHQKAAKMSKIIWFATGVATVVFGAWALGQVNK